MPRSGPRFPAASPKSASRTARTSRPGDILFVIDPRPYQAAVAKAEADLATAITNARLAKTELDRGDRLMKAQALAQRIYRPARQCRRRGPGGDPVGPGGPGAGPARCRPCLCEGADLRPHQPRRDHPGQSGAAPPRRAAADLHRFRQRHLCRFRCRRADLSATMCAIMPRPRTSSRRFRSI